MRSSAGERLFRFFNTIWMLVIMALILFPVMNILSVSVSDRAAVQSGSVTIYPKGFNTQAYREIFHNSTFLRSLLNTVFVTAAGTACAVLITLMVSYAMSRECPGKRFYTYFLVFTMYFSGGVIPTYIIYTRYLHLRNTYWVLFLPAVVNVFYIIVMRSQIEAMPASVFEAAHIDGASEMQTVFCITLPMISPTIAAVSMFFALNFWNSWFNVMVYEDYEKFWTLQYFLRAVVFDKFIAAGDSGAAATETARSVPAENFRMAAIVLTALPIVSIYPFVQKYFVKGIISGSVKG